MSDLLLIHSDRVSSVIIECSNCNNWQQNQSSDNEGICRKITISESGIAWINTVVELGDETPTLRTRKDFSCNQYKAIPRWKDEQLFKEESK